MFIRGGGGRSRLSCLNSQLTRLQPHAVDVGRACDLLAFFMARGATTKTSFRETLSALLSCVWPGNLRLRVKIFGRNTYVHHQVFQVKWRGEQFFYLSCDLSPSETIGAASCSSRCSPMPEVSSCLSITWLISSLLPSGSPFSLPPPPLLPELGMVSMRPPPITRAFFLDLPRLILSLRRPDIT